MENLAALLLLIVTLSRLPVEVTSDRPIVFLRGAGATFPNDVYMAWMASYRSYRYDFVDVRMQYDARGSDYGKHAISNQSYDVEYAGSDASPTEAEMAADRDVRSFPSIAGAIVLGYNVPGVNNLTLTRDHLVGIYNGTYRFWNDPVFALHNPKVVFPSAAITPVARFDSSGTTTTFTKALSAFSDAWNTTYGVFGVRTRWNSSVVSNFGQRTTGLADTLTNIPYSIGYLTLESVKEVNLPHALIVNRHSRAMDGTPAAVQATVDFVPIEQNDGLSADLVDVDSPDAYPIVGFSYFMIRLTYFDDCTQAVELARYVLWFTETEQAYTEARNLLMVPVSDVIATMIRELFLEQMTCAGDKVLDLLARQTYEEEESRKTWKKPVIVVTPFIVVIILCLIGYALRQKLMYIRMLDRDDWSINFFDIEFRAPKSRRQIKVQNGTEIQLDESEPGILSSRDRETSGYPGKLDGQGINIRPTRVPINMATINRRFRQSLMFMRETLNHVNVAKFYGLTTSQNGDVFLVEELCERGRLDELLKHQQYKMEENTLFAIAGDIANGMEFLHNQGIIHGCLRTACCLIDSRWSVKVSEWEYNAMYTVLRKMRQNRNCVDFQKSFLFQLSSKAEDVAYHEFWSPPEVLKHVYLTEPTKAGDVYSFGLVLYEIFTIHSALAYGKQPVTPAATQINRLEKLNRKETIPPKVLHIIENVCNEEFAKRPTFEVLLMMIRTANPSVKYGVLDSMMETMETYIEELEEKTIKNTADNADAPSSNDQLCAQLTSNVEHGREVGGLAREYDVALLGVSVQVQSIISTSSVSEVFTVLEHLLHFVQELVNGNHFISRVEAVSDCAVLAVGLSRPLSASDVSDLAAKALELQGCMAAKWKEVYQAQTSNVSSRNISVISAAIHCGTAFGGSLKYGGISKYLICGEALDTCRKLRNIMASKKRILVTGSTVRILKDCGKFMISPVDVTIKNHFNVELFWLDEMGLQLKRKSVGVLPPVETN